MPPSFSDAFLRPSDVISDQRIGILPRSLECWKRFIVACVAQGDGYISQISFPLGAFHRAVFEFFIKLLLGEG
jgi:hypothetical protein